MTNRDKPNDGNNAKANGENCSTQASRGQTYRRADVLDVAFMALAGSAKGCFPGIVAAIIIGLLVMGGVLLLGKFLGVSVTEAAAQVSFWCVLVFLAAGTTAYNAIKEFQQYNRTRDRIATVIVGALVGVGVAALTIAIQRTALSDQPKIVTNLRAFPNS